MRQGGGHSKPQNDITALIRGLARLVEREVEGARIECDIQAGEGPAGALKNACIIEYPTPLATIRIAVLPVMDPYEAMKAVTLASSGVVDKVVAILPDEAPPRLAEALKESRVAVARADDVLTLLSGVGYRKVVVNSFYVKPKIGESEVARLAEKYRGWLFKRGTYTGNVLIYLPIYIYNMRLHRVDYSDEILEAAEAAVAFEAVSGSLVGSDRKGTLVVMDYWVRLGDLGPDEVRALEVIAREGAASMTALKVALDSEDVRDIVGVLLERKVIDEVEEGVYVLRTPSLAGYMSPLKVFSDSLTPGRPNNSPTLDVEVQFSLLRRIMSVYGDIIESTILYYPLYAISYMKKRDGRHVYSYIIISGISGDRMSDLEEILTSSSRALAKIDSLLKGTLEPKRS